MPAMVVATSASVTIAAVTGIARSARDTNAEKWIQRREADLLPCTYYHVVFTLPQELNEWVLQQPKLLYDCLFTSVWHTLKQFGATTGVQLGMISILHTWGQNLSLHPHLHCIVPGGGVDAQGHWQKQLRSNKYVFSVKAMSKVFRAKYVQQLRAQGIEDKTLLESLFAKGWVVYAKRPFGGPKQVIEYLGRYTHKVAISNSRIQEVTSTEVRFKYKDYKDGGLTKQMVLTNTEFVRRFARAHTAKKICAHQALRHPKQQLETREIAKFTSKLKGSPAGAGTQNHAA